MHVHKFFIVILSIFLSLVNDGRIARRKVMVDRSSITTIAFHSSWYGNRLWTFLPLPLGKLGPSIADEILSILYDLFAGGFPKDMVLLKSFEYGWRDDRLDILEVRIHNDILCRNSLLWVEHKHLLKQHYQAFTARFQ